MSQPAKTAGYATLIERFGVAAVADAILAKWMSDEDADQQWAHLALNMNRLTTKTALSEKEAEVLTLVAAGHRNQVIAALLGKAASTVGKQVKASVKKLGATNTTHAVAIAIRTGQVLPPAAST